MHYLDAGERRGHWSQRVIHAFAIICPLAKCKVIPGQQNAMKPLHNTWHIHTWLPKGLAALIAGLVAATAT
jgi:hypothetical protein